MSKQMASRDCCNMVFAEYATQKPFLYMDYCNATTNETTGEVVHAHGGQGHPKKISFTGERGGTVGFETQLQTYQLFSFITGAAIGNSGLKLIREELTAASTSLSLSQVPVSGTVSVFASNDDCGKAVEITVSEKNVTVPSTGDYIAYYETEKTTGVHVIPITATTFPKAFTAWADTYYKDTNDEITDCQFKAYKCVPQPNFNLSFSNTGDPVTLTVTCDLMGDNKNRIIDYLFEDRV